MTTFVTDFLLPLVPTLVFGALVIVVSFVVLFHSSRDGQSLSVPLICKWGWHEPLYGAWGSDRCARCGSVLN